MIKPEQIITQARTWLGTRYHHQGRLKKTQTHAGGLDCIGLVVGVIDELEVKDKNGIKLSDYDEFNYSANPEGNRLFEIISKHLKQVNLGKMRQGDILLFKTFKEPQHIGFLSNYPSGGWGLIHCNSSSGKVVEQPLSGAWLKMITHIFRI